MLTPNWSNWPSSQINQAISVFISIFSPSIVMSMLWLRSSIRVVANDNLTICRWCHCHCHQHSLLNLHHKHHLCHRWSPNVEVASLLSSALPQNATDFNATVAAYHETAQWVFQPKTSFHTGGTFVWTLPLLGGHCQWRLLVGADQLRQPACPQGSSFYNNPDELLDKDGWEYENFLIETDCRDWGASA